MGKLITPQEAEVSTIFATCCSIVPKIIAFTRLCNLKILFDFQALLRFLLSLDDVNRTEPSLEFDQIKLTNQKAHIDNFVSLGGNLCFLIG